MKKFRKALMAVILVVGLMGFIGYDFLTPAKCLAKEEKAVKEEKAAKETKAAKEDKAAAKETKKAKKATPAKKVVKKEPAAVVVVATPVTTLGKMVSVDIMGAGYDPDEEVRILLADATGMQTDIGYALDSAPKGNKSGAWSTTWAVDDFIKAKLVQVGVFTLTVTNNEFKPLAQTAIAFKEAPKKPEGDKGEKKDGEKKDGEKKGGEQKEKKSDAK